jgi:hypothetical protein
MLPVGRVSVTERAYFLLGPAVGLALALAPWRWNIRRREDIQFLVVLYL